MSYRLYVMTYQMRIYRRRPPGRLARHGSSPLRHAPAGSPVTAAPRYAAPWTNPHIPVSAAGLEFIVDRCVRLGPRRLFSRMCGVSCWPDVISDHGNTPPV